MMLPVNSIPPVELETVALSDDRDGSYLANYAPVDNAVERLVLD